MKNLRQVWTRAYLLIGKVRFPLEITRGYLYRDMSNVNRHIANLETKYNQQASVWGEPCLFNKCIH